MNFLNKIRYDATRGLTDVSAFDKAMWKDELPQELANPSFTFLFSGPPTVPAALDLQRWLTPIGMIQNVNQQSSRPLTGIKELGRRYRKIVGTSFNHAVSLNRVLGKDANLVGMLYRWAYNLDSNYIADPAADQPTYRQMVGLDSDLLQVPFGLYHDRRHRPTDRLEQPRDRRVRPGGLQPHRAHEEHAQSHQRRDQLPLGRLAGGGHGRGRLRPRHGQRPHRRVAATRLNDVPPD